jgi:hypothetical protein
LNVCHKDKPCAHRTFLGLRVNGVMVTSWGARGAATTEHKTLRLAVHAWRIARTAQALGQGNAPLQRAMRGSTRLPNELCACPVTIAQHCVCYPKEIKRPLSLPRAPRCGAPFLRTRNAARHAGLMPVVLALGICRSHRAASTLRRISNRLQAATQTLLPRPTRRTPNLRQSCGAMPSNMWITRGWRPKNGATC